MPAKHAAPHGRLAALTLPLALAGCATSPPAGDDWPGTLPPRAYYERIHTADSARGEVDTLEEYLVWVTRFYRGWGPYPYGWDAMSEAALRDIPPQHKATMRAKLAHLGRLISGEWAKSRARTRIPNRVLSVWAQAMGEAIEQGQVEAFLDRATADVEALLAGELDVSVIRIERYFPDVGIEA